MTILLEPDARVADAENEHASFGLKLDGRSEESFYTAYYDGRSWCFRPGSGKPFRGFLTKDHAEQMAERTEREDRHEAEHGTSIIARVLRKHFGMH